MPGGRPSKYKPEFAEQAKELCLLGATDEDIARFLKVTVTTISNWKNEHPEFLEALKDGKTQADAEVEKSLYDRAMGYKHPSEKIFLDKEGNIVRAEYTEHYPPDPTSMIFWLKNRQPKRWRDKQEVEHSGDIKINVFVEEKRGSKPQA